MLNTLLDKNDTYDAKIDNDIQESVHRPLQNGNTNNVIVAIDCE